MTRPFAAATILLGLLAALGSALHGQSVQTYSARLSTVPLAAYSADVVGSGEVTATVTGTRLSIQGTFKGLATPATVARIHTSWKPGIRGEAIFELTIAKATSGTITGIFNLTPEQAFEIRQHRYYIQIHSEKGLAPDGANLWGWLLR